MSQEISSTEAPTRTVLRLDDLLTRQVAAAPGATAFVHGGQTETRAAFATRVALAEDWLASQGIGTGDRVAVWLVNRPAWPALLFALARRGAALVAVNTRYRAAELKHLLALSQARLLITQVEHRGIDFPGTLAQVDGDRLPALKQIAVLDEGRPLPARLLGRPVLALTGLEEPVEAAVEGDSVFRSRRPPSAVDPDSPCVLFSTSGTTKGPKLVIHPQHTITRHVQRCALALGLDQPEARLAAMMPLCGTYGLIAALAAFAGGAPIHVFDSFDAAADARRLREQRLTHAFLTDDMLRRLAAEVAEDPPFPAARIFGFAAFAPGAAETVAALQVRGVPVRGLYGSSEVSALFSIQGLEQSPAGQLAGGGRPMSAEAVVRIRDLESGGLLPIGETGEIEIRADSNFNAYLDNPQATAEAIDAEGFFRTGDVGHLRADGSFVYESRRDDSIRLSGFLVNPAEIEDPLKSVPGVSDVQVVAVPVAGRLRAVAFVIPTPGAAPTPTALIEASTALMAPYRQPARVWLVDAFPATDGPNGTKIQRGRLREMALVRLAAEAAEAADAGPGAA